MSRINKIEKGIVELSSASFQKFCDSYLCRKIKYDNITSLGSKEGADKTTRGIPDTLLEVEGKFIYAMYGSYNGKTKAFNKLKEDIKQVKEKILKDSIHESNVDRIICCHTSSNIDAGEISQLKQQALPHKLQIFGVNDIAQDIDKNMDMHRLASDYLGLDIFSGQTWNIQDFIRMHDRSKTNAQISNEYIGDIDKILDSIDFETDEILLISSKPGMGKTKLAIEICKQLQDEYNIICVKNSDLPVYNDIKAYLCRDKRNLIFIDDVNTVRDRKAILDLLGLRSDVSFILTVRDYAERDVIENVKPYKYKTITPKKMTHKEMNKLISDFSDNKIPSNWREHIKRVSGGNPRMAAYVAKLSETENIFNLQSVSDILKSYYGAILEDNKIDICEQKTLLAIACAGGINIDLIDKNNVLSILLDLLDLTTGEFKDGVLSLNAKELCDDFEGVMFKISDRSLADYIVLEFLVKNSNLISGIINKLYLIDKDRVVDIVLQINTFIDQENISMLANPIRDYYDQNRFNSEFEAEEFLAIFNELIPIKSLNYIKSEIEKMGEKCYDRKNFDVISERDKDIGQKLKILHNLSITKYRWMVLDLLIMYFEKNPNAIEEICSVIRHGYSYIGARFEDDPYTILDKTIAELMKLDKAKRQNQDLIINILNYFLNFKFDTHRYNQRDHTITSETLAVPLSERLAKSREFVLISLAEIYNPGDRYAQTNIHKVLYNYRYKINNSFVNYEAVVRSDLDLIERLFFEDVLKLSATQEMIIYSLKHKASTRNIEIFEQYHPTERQNIYNMLIDDSVAYKLCDDTNDKIQQAIEKCRNNWNTIFKWCLEFNQDEIMRCDRINSSLLTIFNHLKSKDRADFLENMIICRYEFTGYINCTPMYFLGKLNEEDRARLLTQIPEETQPKWNLAYLIIKEEPNSQDIKKLKEILSNGIVLDFCSAVDFVRYIKKDETVLELLEENRDYKFIIPYVLTSKQASDLMKIINIDKLKGIYMEVLKDRTVPIDSNHELFKILGQSDPSFCVKCLNLADNRREYDYLVRIIKGLPNSADIFREVLIYLIRNPYEYRGWFGEIITTNPESILDILERENDTEVIIGALNAAINHIDDNDKKVDIFKKAKERGFLKEKFDGIRIIPNSASWSGSLEYQKEFCCKIRDVFKDDVEYLRFISEVIEESIKHLDNKIRYVSKEEFIKDGLLF